MKNRRQFVRQTAAVLPTGGLLAGLLPASAAAQGDDLEARANYVIGTYEGGDIRRASNFAAVTPLARLALNPDDQYAIDEIASYYDKPFRQGATIRLAQQGWPGCFASIGISSLPHS